MDWLDRAEEGRPLSGLECILRPQLKMRYEELCLLEEIKWRQRSRVQWLKVGDSNTKFFHRRANCRRNLNRITNISDGSSSLSDSVDIANHLLWFFRNQLGVKIIPGASIDLHLLYGGEALDLSPLHAPFSAEEVLRAVSSSPPEKAPGPDGFPMLFYQQFWDIIKDDVLGVFEGYFSGAINLASVNTSWICLIPKKSETSTARDFRPISLVHSLLKLLSKVLAARLQRCVQSLINPLQSAFIKGRHILDNLFCAHFLVHHLQSTKTPAVVLKLDFERAFDHVNWHFLKDIFLARGFGDRWIGWIDGLLSSASTAVLLNRVPGNFFSCERGLRQGDPLSPLLFILCVDVLFRMLQAAVDADLLPAVKLGELKFHSLQFADDMLLFFDGTIESAAVIKLILDGFSACSGLKINFRKSSITPINLMSEQAASLGAFFTCPLKEFPLSYLGLPLSPRNLRKEDFLPLIEKLNGRLAGWKGYSLSRGGAAGPT